MYYYGYRFYVPALGRWLSRDPIGEKGGLNLYGWCMNNGINGIDLLGSVYSVIYRQWDERFGHAWLHVGDTSVGW